MHNTEAIEHNSTQDYHYQKEHEQYVYEDLTSGTYLEQIPKNQETEDENYQQEQNPNFTDAEPTRYPT